MIGRQVWIRTCGAALAALALATLAGLAAGCDENNGGADAGMDAGQECGNGTVEGSEACDDGNDSNDDRCLTSCRLACGDGVVNPSERCDTAIAAGSAGACPSDTAACDDGMACTADVLSGLDCEATCEHAPITVCADDDGCCAPGCDPFSDNDCPGTCGNEIVEPDETCEEDILPGCPTDCNDGVACTSDVLAGDPSTCDSRCVFAPITSCVDGDRCCPSGCNPSTDSDCPDACRNMSLDPGELCEEGTAMPCPTECDDGDVCTENILMGSAEACTAECYFPAVEGCVNGDGCCGRGCNMTNDTDCLPLCGNGALEAGEECDDGNVVPGDGCDEMCHATEPPATGFRLMDLDLRDPHAFTEIGSCQDITETVLGLDGLNPQIQTAIETDDDGDGLLDLSFALVFRPLDQRPTGGGRLDFLEAECTAPASSTSCTPATGGTTVSTTYTNRSTGTCVGVASGTTGGYTPGIAQPAAPCFESAAVDVTLSLGTIALTLRDTQVGGTYVGNPATRLSNGMLRGFLTQRDAESAMIPMDIPLVGGRPLAALLPGHPTNCSPVDERDMHPTHGIGWWFYLNFPATRVPYMD